MNQQKNLSVLTEFSDALPVGICVIDRKHTILFWNRTIADWSGYSAGEMAGENLLDLYPDLNTPSYRVRIDQVLDGGPPAVFSSQLHTSFIPCRKADGMLRVQQTSVIRYPGSDPDHPCVMIIIEDVTELDHEIRSVRQMKDQALLEVQERKKAENALEKLNAKLNLLSSVTRHDILNKIMVIDGFLGFAEEMATDPTQAEYLGHVRAAATIIQNILVFNRQYEQLGIEEPTWFAMDTLIEAIDTEERLPIHSACEGVSIYCDPMLEKVFYNLYDNALRHAEGATRIEITCLPSSSGLRIIWEDDGPGVPEDDKEEIFKRGYGKNTGLGLFLVREILAITGITITETGEEGKGARFEFCVPEGEYRIGNSA